jgi:HSP20 family molecular chaperone IbpA
MKTGNLSIFDTILNDFSDVKFRRNYLSDYDVHKTEDGAYYVFSVPGFNKSNLKVDVDDTILTIDTSKLEATIEDGLLSVFIPNETKVEKKKKISLL